MPAPAPTHPMPVSVHVLRHVSTVLVRAAAASAVVFLVALLLEMALDDGRLGAAGAARAGLARFLGNLSFTAGVWGVAVALAAAQVTTYFQHRGTRKVLDRIARSPDAPRDPPVAWQHEAVRRKRAGFGMQLLGFPVVIFFGFIGAVGFFVADEEPENLFAWALGLSSPILVGLGVWMIVAGSRKVNGPAHDRWAAAPMRPASGTLTPGDRDQLRGARPGIGRLGRLLGVRSGLRWAAGATVGLIILLVGIELPAPAVWAVVVIGVLLLAMAAIDVALSWLLRPTLLREAADPDSPAPAPSLLRVATSQDVPWQSALDWLFAASVALLVVGVAGIRTGPEYPLSDVYQLFQLAATAGGVGLLFHTSGTFSNRSRIRDENEFLSRRWD
ncbi:hypothetical protein FOJ82_02345 [Tessaracoccus rhinocerotis]|uniref:Uncharacterized protein n=1 Tax=Tessaracoccus rhinocerotis TaxID=1689449 RepID=A0A553K4V7_9ACTN|nr:hypothetical protein [Tessaracoccus rhinocerotis]TRY19743.1 hypothetical protein FOJ82_02345 [Tessaracoccus rhinocerotis]